MGRPEIATPYDPVHMGPLLVDVDDRVELFSDERVDLIEVPSVVGVGDDRRSQPSEEEQDGGGGSEQHIECFSGIWLTRCGSWS